MTKYFAFGLVILFDVSVNQEQIGNINKDKNISNSFTENCGIDCRIRERIRSREIRGFFPVEYCKRKDYELRKVSSPEVRRFLRDGVYMLWSDFYM